MNPDASPYRSPAVVPQLVPSTRGAIRIVRGVGFCHRVAGIASGIIWLGMTMEAFAEVPPGFHPVGMRGVSLSFLALSLLLVVSGLQLKKRRAIGRTLSNLWAAGMFVTVVVTALVHSFYGRGRGVDFQEGLLMSLLWLVYPILSSCVLNLPGVREWALWRAAEQVGGTERNQVKVESI